MTSGPVSSLLPSGAVFHGRYRIVRALKAGGMGTVYEAVDENTAAPRALKVMLPSLLGDADQRARFALEARVTGGIESDHLVRVSDSGVDEASGSPFLVMELLRGEELGDLLARVRTLPPSEVVTLLSQASLALDKTHAASIVHRDLKPDNLVVTRRDDGSPCLKILDFGIAKVVATNHAAKTRALGTPLYMAPEQMRGDSAIGPRADLYSLAHVAFTLLTGEPYWAEEAVADGSLYTLLTRVLSGAVEPPSARAHRRAIARGVPPVHLPPAFDAWFLKATTVSPEARFDRASTQTAALAEMFAAPPPSIAFAPTERAGAGNMPVPVPAVPLPPTLASPIAAPSPPKSRAILIAVLAIGAVLAVGLVLVGIWLVSGSGGSTPATGPISGCPPNATCANLDIPDPAHVDPTALYPAVEKMAKAADGRVVLIMITGEVSQDGTADISAEKSLAYQYAIPGATISIVVRGKLAILQRINPFGNPTPLPPPACSTKAAWKAAVAGGMAPTGPMSLLYMKDLSLGLPGWGLTSTKSRYFVDNKSCTLKASLKW